MKRLSFNKYNDSLIYIGLMIISFTITWVKVYETNLKYIDMILEILIFLIPSIYLSMNNYVDLVKISNVKDNKHSLRISLLATLIVVIYSFLMLLITSYPYFVGIYSIILLYVFLRK